MLNQKTELELEGLEEVFETGVKIETEMHPLTAFSLMISERV